MRRPTRWSALFSAALFVVLLFTWGAVSSAWIALLKQIALPLAAGGPVTGPSGASVTLPLVLCAICLLRLSVARRAALMVVAVVLTFGLELLLVALGAAAHASPSLMSSAGGIAQNVVPIAVFVVGMRMAAFDSERS